MREATTGYSANTPVPTPPLEILRSRMMALNDRADHIAGVLSGTSTRLFGANPKQEGIVGNPTPTPVPNGHIEAMSDAIERLEQRMTVIENYSALLDSAV